MTPDSPVREEHVCVCVKSMCVCRAMCVCV